MSRSAVKLPRGVFETSPGSNKFGIRVTDASGKRTERAIGTKAEAVKALKEEKNKRRRSKVLAPEKPKPTFREIADLGIAYARENQSYPGAMQSQIEHFCGDFGHRIAGEISTTEIEAWLNSKAVERDWSEKEWSARTKRDYRTAIRTCYSEAMRVGLLDADPTEPIVYRRTPQKEIRDVTEDELVRLRASIAIPGNLRRTPKFCHKCLAQLEIALQTGMRMSEQFGGAWENIDWELHVLFIPRSKNREPRDVYLNSYAIAILREIQAEQTLNGIPPTGRIFGISNPTGWTKDTLKFAHIQGVTWNTLRHHFATHLVRVNVSIKHVQDLMGHLDPESTTRYIHPTDMDVMAAIALIAGDGNPEYVTNMAYLESLSNEQSASVATGVHKAPIGNEQPSQNLVNATIDGARLPSLSLRRISREELYELVWSKPVIHVSRLLGRSDVAVAKACRKRKISVPPRGYWAKLAAGKPVPPRPPLPLL